MHSTHNPSPITHHLSEKHTFSSKERDVETGLSYFGARYYSSDLSIWLSVDPMADKYPSLSPYVYCANNPVKLVDPNGDEIGDFFDYSGNYLGTDATLNILSFYNTTDISVTKENRTDNSLLSTHFKSGKLTANISNWRWNVFINNSYDIISSFDHEKGHFKHRKEIGVDAMLKMAEKECKSYAIDYQQKQSNYDKTSSDYTRHIEDLKSKTK